MSNVVTGGNIIGVNPVDGTTGIISIGLSRRCCNYYTQLLTRNAYINVHLNDGAGLSP
jgi:hypothetical protein